MAFPHCIHPLWDCAHTVPVCMCVTSLFIKRLVCEVPLGGPLGGLVLIMGGSYCSTSLRDTSQLRVSEEDKEIRETKRRWEGGGGIRAYLYQQSNMKTHRQWGSHHGPSKSNLIDCKSGYSTPQNRTPVYLPHLPPCTKHLICLPLSLFKLVCRFYFSLSLYLRLLSTPAFFLVFLFFYFFYFIAHT